MSTDLLDRLSQRAVNTDSSAQPLITPRLYSTPGQNNTDDEKWDEGSENQVSSVKSILTDRPDPAESGNQQLTHVKTGQRENPKSPIHPVLADATEKNKDEKFQQETPKQEILSKNNITKPERQVYPHDKNHLSNHKQSTIIPAQKVRPRKQDSIKDSSNKQQTVVNVHIGRIEVRAQAPAAPIKLQTKRKSVPSAMSLNAYLNQRGRGG